MEDYEYYVIKSHQTDKVYYANIRYRHDTSGRIFNRYIIFGGRRIDCLEMSVNDDTAYVSQIKYHSDCCIHGELNRKKKETVDFLHTCFHFVQQKFPFVSSFVLDDFSNVMCETTQKSMLLAYLYLIKYNKTWYEKHFDAHMDDTTRQHRYEECRAKFNSKEYKETHFPTHASFASYFKYPIRGHVDVLEQMYADAPTIRLFLAEVVARFDCSTYTQFLNTFFVQFFLFDPLSRAWKFSYTPHHDISYKELAYPRKQNRLAFKKIKNHNERVFQKALDFLQ